jgi:hypothetical protein
MRLAASGAPAAVKRRTVELANKIKAIRVRIDLWIYVEEGVV